MLNKLKIFFVFLLLIKCVLLFSEQNTFDSAKFKKSINLTSHDGYSILSVKYFDLFDENNVLKPSANILLEDIFNFKKDYYPDGSILLIGYDSPEIKIGFAKSLGLQLAKEIRNYFFYWLNYWNIKLKFVSLSSYEQSFKDKEYIKIIITDLNVVDGSYDKLFSNLDKLKNFNGIEISKTGRYIKINIDVLFDEDTTELRKSSFPILDSIIEILKLSNNNLGLKIEVYKNFIYEKGLKNKNMIIACKNIAKVFQQKSKGDIYVFSKEDIISPKKIDMIFFKKHMKIKELKDNIDQYEENYIKKENIFVYKNYEDQQNRFFPTGWIGDINDLTLDFHYKDLDASSSCIKISYIPNGDKGWAGVQWQYPANNWGNKKESLDLTGYKKVVFYAKGVKGKEIVSEFKVGGIQGQYSDSDVAWIGNITLTDQWKKYEISLRDKDLRRVIGGFRFVLNKNDNKYGATIYLDNIYFE